MPTNFVFTLVRQSEYCYSKRDSSLDSKRDKGV